jgi:membrane-associated phospholipid phosphatase
MPVLSSAALGMCSDAIRIIALPCGAIPPLVLHGALFSPLDNFLTVLQVPVVVGVSHLIPSIVLPEVFRPCGGGGFPVLPFAVNTHPFGLSKGYVPPAARKPGKVVAGTQNLSLGA